MHKCKTSPKVPGPNTLAYYARLPGTNKRFSKVQNTLVSVKGQLWS